MKKLLLVLCLLLLPVAKSHAFVYDPSFNECAYQDSGMNYYVPPSGIGCFPDFHPSGTISAAYKFNLDDPLAINSIEGWTGFQDENPHIRGIGGADFVIYGGTLHLDAFHERPLVSNEIFRQHFNFLEDIDVDSYQQSPKKWHGVYDLDLVLDKGEYWVGYENGNWATTASLPIRFDVVPEPISLLLFASGLVGMAGLKRKMK